MFGISRYRYHAIYRMISIRCDMYYIYTATRSIIRRNDVCVRSGRDQSLKQKLQYTNWPQKALRSLRAAFYIGRFHERTPVRHKGTRGKETEFCFFFFATKTTKTSKVVGKGEECVPCDPGYELRREGAWQSHAQKIHEDGTEIKSACMNVFPALLGVCIDRLGAVPSNNNP